MLISLENVSKKFNEKVILDHVNLYANHQDKIGIIGVNGTGKSTLLKMIAGIEPMDEGKLTQSSGKRVLYLPQNPIFDEAKTIHEVVKEGFLEDHEEFHEYEVEAILKQLGIKDSSMALSTLSGGERKRVALACVLLRKSDCLLLDEPTNHLDMEMIEWLQKRLNQYSGNIIMVTHDRYFLDRICNRIVELDNGKVNCFEGNYETYLQLKAEMEEMALASERKRQSILRKEAEWISRGALARSTKSKERIARFEALSAQEGPQAKENVKLDLVGSRLGKKTVEINDISKSFDGRTLFEHFSYNVLKHDRIGIIGSNGSGKTTLFKIILKKIKPDEGEVVIGDTVRIGYFSQHSDELDGEKRVIDLVKEISDRIETTDKVLTASQMCERFLFDKNEQYQKVSRLSGGELRRLHLLRVLMGKPNILFFDEPTNDLDIATLTILEDYLEDFDGAVITISHDRYFLDKICDQIFSFEEGKIKAYPGGYSDYLEKRNIATKEKEQKKQWVRNSQIPSMSSKEKKEFEVIDEELEKLNEQLAMLDQQMNNCDDYTKVAELSEQRSKLEETLAYKEERWVYLNELYDKIQKFKEGHR